MTVDAVDLRISGGRVIDPGQPMASDDLAIRGDRIAALDGQPRAAREIDATGMLVVPGLIDYHTHCYAGVSHFGVDADTRCLQRGVTTAVDAGSAGPRTFPGFRRYVIDRVRTRLLAFVHVAAQGMITPHVGELEDLRWAAPEEAVACAREHDDVVIGIKVRLGYQMVGRDPLPALNQARWAADALEKPLMVHITDMPMPLPELLLRMGAGDVVTHCFHGKALGGILDIDGRVLPEARTARERGVVFDVGHGSGSFSFAVAAAALAQDFPPDTISSDVHAYNTAGPVYDQATTLCKFLHLGMGLDAVVAATTATPARLLGRPELGTLAPDTPADVTILERRRGRYELTDAPRTAIEAAELLVPRWVIRAGEPFELDSPVPAALQVGVEKVGSGR